MKTSFILLLALGLVAHIGQAQTFTASPDRQSLKILQTVTPVFPMELPELGYMEGEARIAIAVDETGKLTDWLVVGYTHRRFADESVSAIKQWEFEPARVRGKPVSVQIELLISFETSGVVISSADLNSAMQRYSARLFKYRDAYRPCTMKEIDRIPTPQNAVSPVYGETLAKKGVQGTVTIEFFIDETGAMRMPAVLSADYDELASLAVAAVQQWKFEPPTRKGVPVMVRAKQVFHFGPKQAEAPGTSADGQRG
jgi:TonB family protein